MRIMRSVGCQWLLFNQFSKEICDAFKYKHNDTDIV